MKKVFGKDPVTSSDFPYVIFAARGLLMHESPSLAAFFFKYLENIAVTSATKAVSLQDIERTLVSVNRSLNEKSRSEANSEIPEHLFLEALSKAYLSNEEQARDLKAAYEGSVKWVIAEEVLTVCGSLRDRGYRTGIASNSDHRLSELMRLQGLLGFFDFILTADDLGVRKPNQKFFEEVVRETGVLASQIVYVGSSYGADVAGAKRAGLESVLYDPKQTQIRSLAEPSDMAEKVVSLESLRQNRFLEEVKVITQFSEILEFFQ